MWAWSSCGGGDDDTELGEQEVTGDVLAWRKKKKKRSEFAREAAGRWRFKEIFFWRLKIRRSPDGEFHKQSGQ